MFRSSSDAPIRTALRYHAPRARAHGRSVRRT